MERPATHSAEDSESTANLYLSNLGLEWSELQGKKVLDIGALHAQFESAARRRGVDVVSLDNEIAEGEHAPPTDSHFVVANATKMPFADESFEYAIAHMSVMNYLEKGYGEDYVRYVEDTLRESYRVLKPAGQFHFTNTLLDEVELRKGDADEVPDKKSDAYVSWKIEREHEFLEKIAKSIGYHELKLKIYPDSHPPKKDFSKRLTHYYVAVK